MKAEFVRVELQLGDGPAYRFDLPLDSAAHRELIALGSSIAATDPPRLLQLPLDGGRTALSFTSRQLVRLTLTPAEGVAVDDTFVNREPPRPERSLRRRPADRDEWIEHILAAIDAAETGRSELSADVLSIEGSSATFTRAFLNRLGSFADCRFLEIGSARGAGTCTALHGNRVAATCIDDGLRPAAAQAESRHNVRRSCGNGTVRLIEQDCFAVGTATLGPFDIYVYDGDPDRREHCRALEHFHATLAPVAVYVVPQWNREQVRHGTRAALLETPVDVLFEIRRPPGGRHDAGTPITGDHHAWGNGIAVFLLKRRDDGISKPAEEAAVDQAIVAVHPSESFTSDGVQFPDEIPANEYGRLQRKVEPQLERFHRRQSQRHDELSRLCAEVPEGPLIVTTFNHGFADLFQNWVASCDAHRIAVRDRTIVFATDSGAHELARAHGFRSFVDTESYGEVTRESVAAYGDHQYRELMFVKSAVVEDALRLGRDVLFQDIDLVWLKDPLPTLRDGAQRRGFDYQFMFDGPNPRFRHTHFNSGFFYIRNSAPAREVWSLITNRYDRVLWCGSQQVVVNIVMQHFQKQGLRVLRLPEYAFLNGHLLHRARERRWSPALAAAASVVHASWTENLEAKVGKLRENGLWYLPT